MKMTKRFWTLMNKKTIPKACILCISFLPCLADSSLISAGSSATDPLPVLNTPLLNELKAMYEKDQRARFAVIDSGQSTWKEEDAQMMEAVDQENLLRLKKIVAQFGWPGFQLVGEEGADQMWALIQHCDRDTQFQRACLQLLKEAVAKGDAPKRHLAYLTDRVLVNEELPQVYGTQFQSIDGKAIVCPIEEPEKLDSRRAEMGLEPFADYASALKKLYHIKE